MQTFLLICLIIKGVQMKILQAVHTPHYTEIEAKIFYRIFFFLYIFSLKPCIVSDISNTEQSFIYEVLADRNDCVN